MNTRTTERLAAVLGPTNTGKTHYAIERMLGHTSGMIGFPLRLLAREAYDRVVKAKGPSRVALITGEEKITPPNAQYFICTVESMPVQKPVGFMAIDEVQLAGDPQRGHVFTERLLHARGLHETLFLGSDTMRPMIRRLFPEAEIMGRERFSRLSFVPPQKLSRLPRRTALVAFTANDVYALAEVMRRQKGGAAIVMGSLSPRTRNAQVELYQSGEVDYLVATDAIGMGLNMDIDHVAFAATRKFDGRTYRDLIPAEMAQIAGRAGRHMNDGTFTLLTDAEGGVDTQTINRIEGHDFEPQRHIFWRNSKLDYGSPKALINSLERASSIKGLNRAPDAMDMNILRALASSTDVQTTATNPAAVQRLWDVCQIPDFERLSQDRHMSLIHRIYGDLMSDKGVIDHDWMHSQVSRLDNVQGDIDTLAARIASIRIWTYVSHRRNWLAEGAHWAHVTRSVEDRLSDALHERLMQRFVDRRTAVLLKGLKAKGNLLVTIEDMNRVMVEGHFIGTLEGFSFSPDESRVQDDHKTLQQTASSALREEVIKRAQAFVETDDKSITLVAPNLSQPELHWNGAIVAHLVKGDNLFRPRVKLLPGTLLDGTAADQVVERLNTWLQTRINDLLLPLMNIKNALEGQQAEGAHPLDGMARGIAFQLLEHLSVLPRRLIDADIRKLDQDSRKGLRQYGVRIGSTNIFIPVLLKPHATLLRLVLWALDGDIKELPAQPTPGMVWCENDKALPRRFYELAGFNITRTKAVRIDMMERLADTVRPMGMNGAKFEITPEIMGLVGLSGDDFNAVMETLGYGHELADRPLVDTVAAPEADVAKDGSEKATAEAPQTAVDETASPAATSTDESNAEEPAEAAKITLFFWKPANKAKSTPRRHNKARADKGDNPSAKGRPAKGKHAKGRPERNKPHTRSSAPAKVKEMDPNSPFAALQSLKQQMKS